MERIRNHLQKSEFFVDVKFMPNFQLDHDNTLLHGRDIYKGLVVTLKPGYQLTAADAIWMHPNNAQCRALFNGGNYVEQNNLPSTNAVVGTYQTTHIDELGDEVNNTFTIVDTHLHQEWEGDIENVYSNKYQTEVLNKCKETASHLGAENMISASYTNMIFKGANTFHYYNGVYRDTGLVLLSPLRGYVMVQGKDHAADLVDENNHLENLNKAQLTSIHNRCSWVGERLVNTFVLKKTLDTAVSGTSYRPLQISVSQTPIHGNLTPRQLLTLSPKLKDIPDNVFAPEHVQEEKIKLAYSTDLIRKLLEIRNECPILNMYNNGILTLPRYIVEKIV